MLPDRFAESELALEAVHTAVNLLSTFHDSIVNDSAAPAGEPRGAELVFLLGALQQVHAQPGSCGWVGGCVRARVCMYMFACLHRGGPLQGEGGSASGAGGGGSILACMMKERRTIAPGRERALAWVQSAWLRGTELLPPGLLAAPRRLAGVEASLGFHLCRPANALGLQVQVLVELGALAAERTGHGSRYDALAAVEGLK